MTDYYEPRLTDLLTGGTVRRITKWGEDVMHHPTTPITTFDDDLRELARDMYATMQAADGVGLAATQIGLSLSLFVISCPDADGKTIHLAMCNPVVTLPEGRARHLDASDEGCLSWSGAFQPLSRPDKATCRGYNLWGEEIEVVGDGLLARCLQHETDHLNGIVFGDRLSARSRKLLDAEHYEVADLYPDDWPIHPMNEG